MSNTLADLEHRQPGRRWQPSSEEAEASVMLDLFQGLGVHSFSLTFTDDTGRKVAFKRNRSVELLRSELPCLLFTSCEKRLNVIVRPIAARTLSFIQLDDLSASQLDRVRAFSFLVLETSPENFQAWVAVTDASPETIRRVKKAAGADLNASGATRLAGSYNFKSKYAPNYPRVRLQSIAPLHAVTVGELDRAGLMAPEEHTPCGPRHAPTHRRRHRLLVALTSEPPTASSASLPNILWIATSSEGTCVRRSILDLSDDSANGDASPPLRLPTPVPSPTPLQG